MGVTGLWSVLQPAGRPTKIETLNNKRLAVDSSLWIYQFLKAVRDKEGNQLRNSHIVGFFRRICKLLFIGIKPVFVFDGAAPVLKKQTITNRKRRREGRREDAAKTAGKLLALQMQRAAEEETKRKRERKDGAHQLAEDEPAVPEEIVYAEEVNMSQKERQKNKSFKKTDAYHLPELNGSMAEMGSPNDPRIMNLEELQQYANQFSSGEDINFYDFSKIDFDGVFFQSLPAADQYNILNAARLRSRLRMGYSKDQLDTMFPDRMAFSKFQIDRVRERNELTQRLMRLLGMTGDGTLDGSGRIAGERGREYVLVKNDGVEGGWILGVVTQSEGSKPDKPIDVDLLDKKSDTESDEEDDEVFEDIPIEGLNRLPKQDARPGLMNELLSSNIRRRKDFWKSKSAFTGENKPKKQNTESDSLFVEKNDSEDGLDDHANEEEEDLQRAIAMSLENQAENNMDEQFPVEEEQEPLFVPQRKVQAPNPFAPKPGQSLIRSINAESRTIPAVEEVDSSDEEDFKDLQDALRKSKSSAQTTEPTESIAFKTPLPPKPKNFPGFDGPLPFEKLDLGLSLFDKTKKKEIEKLQQVEDEGAGGFVQNEKPQSGPVPPWFASNDGNNEKAKKSVQKLPRTSNMNKRSSDFDFEFETGSQINPRKSPEIINIYEEDNDDDDIQQDETEANISSLDNLQTLRQESTVDEEVSRLQLSNHLNQKEEYSEKGNDVESEEEEWENVQSQPIQQQSNGTKLVGSPEVEIILPDGIEIDEDESQTSKPEFQTDALKSSAELIDDPDIKIEEDDTPHYSDEEDEQLFRQIMQEDQEHERFKSRLQNQDLLAQIPDFEEELKKLKRQQKSDKRDADEVTQNMITECQQLLTLFGLPFITAPMEAEAQCAELVRLGLVDGVVTDDSDIFLFGGSKVFRHMFNQAKVVECYLAHDLEDEFGLTRDRLIALAQLLGSDYTEGLAGVGPVTALEIISEFDTLANFRTWFTAVQTGARPRAADAMSERAKFSRLATKVTLPPAFPDVRVVQAYLQPEVDSDPSAFVWGVPDLDGLRSFLAATIGWSLERTDEVLVPVVRLMNQREGTQSNITAFVSGAASAGAFAPRQRIGGGSKRLRSALEKIGGKGRTSSRAGVGARNMAQATRNRDMNENQEIIDEEDDEEEEPRPAPKKRAKKKKAPQS